MTHPATTGLQLHSLIKDSGELELSLRQLPVAEPAVDEVIIRVEAAPLNPSDFNLLFGAADMTTAKASGTAEFPVVTASDLLQRLGERTHVQSIAAQRAVEWPKFIAAVQAKYQVR